MRFDAPLYLRTAHLFFNGTNHYGVFQPEAFARALPAAPTLASPARSDSTNRSRSSRSSRSSSWAISEASAASQTPAAGSKALRDRPSPRSLLPRRVPALLLLEAADLRGDLLAQRELLGARARRAPALGAHRLLGQQRRARFEAALLDLLACP